VWRNGKARFGSVFESILDAITQQYSLPEFIATQVATQRSRSADLEPVMNGKRALDC